MYGPSGDAMEPPTIKILNVPLVAELWESLEEENCRSDLSTANASNTRIAVYNTLANTSRAFIVALPFFKIYSI
jgi:hypothetical protein